MDKSRRLILAQGDRDGACFLYSIANAVAALEGRVGQPSWRRAVSQLAYKVDDLLSGKGTSTFGDSEDRAANFCRDFLKGLGSALSVSPVKLKSSYRQISALINRDQVLIAAVHDDSHWAAMVDTDNEQVCLACSEQLLLGTGEYMETKSQLERIYNLKRPVDDLRILDHYGLVLSR